MTDLDKVARDILDSIPDAAFGTADDFPGHAHVVLESEARYAIRAALMTAPPGYVLVDRATLLEMRDVAMRWNLVGRAPECGAFSRIAQDADAMLAAAPEVK